MKKKAFTLPLSVAALPLIGALTCLVACGGGKSQQEIALEQQVKELQELAEMDKREMENEYQSFANQYQEMKMRINNDSLIAQLEIEQKRAQDALAELQRTKSSNAKEIQRLKEELKTLRAILKDYVRQVDSLQRLNQQLSNENQNLRSTNEQQQQHISSLTGEKDALSQKVSLAAQLNASAITARGHNKRGKATDKIKDVRKFVISFKIDRNPTAQAGNRTLYLRITTPLGDVLTRGGSFHYENRDLTYSIRKDIEYNGEDTQLTVYWDVAETLSDGTYRIDIFADGHHIGQTSTSFR